MPTFNQINLIHCDLEYLFEPQTAKDCTQCSFQLEFGWLQQLLVLMLALKILKWRILRFQNQPSPNTQKRVNINLYITTISSVFILYFLIYLQVESSRLSHLTVYKIPNNRFLVDVVLFCHRLSSSTKTFFLDPKITKKCVVWQRFLCLRIISKMFLYNCI